MLVQNQEASKGQIQPFLFHFLNEKLDKLFDKGLFFGGGDLYCIGLLSHQIMFNSASISMQEQYWWFWKSIELYISKGTSRF